VEEYLKLNFRTKRQLITSVDPEKYRVDSKYNESLKEFLKPTIQYVDLNNNKFGKKLKTHAQALGVGNDSAKGIFITVTVNRTEKNNQRIVVNNAVYLNMIRKEFICNLYLLYLVYNN